MRVTLEDLRATPFLVPIPQFDRHVIAVKKQNEIANNLLGNTSPIDLLFYLLVVTLHPLPEGGLRRMPGGIGVTN